MLSHWRVAAPAGLRKLLVDDAYQSTDLDLQHPKINVVAFDDSSHGIAEFEGSNVLIERVIIWPRYGWLPSRDVKEEILLNRKPFEPAEDSDFRVLFCKGYIERPPPQPEFQLVFDIPLAYDPIPNSLIELIDPKASKKPSLGQRFQLCYILAQSMSLFHCVGWIHRSFRSDNVIFLSKASQDIASPKEDLENPIICGFDACRLESDFSTGPRDDLIALNIYSHPNRCVFRRRCLRSTTTYMVSVFCAVWREPLIECGTALGVVLLEIGVWERAMTIGGNNFEKIKDPNPVLVSKEILRQAQRRLGQRCGEKFQAIVSRCLTGNFDVDQGAEDILHPKLQASFREFVVEQLQQLADNV